MEPPEQKQDPDNKENPPDNSTPIIKGQHDKNDSAITTGKTKKEEKERFHFWRNASKTQKTQMILVLLNLLTLLAFIIMNIIQVRHSKNALDYADSTNVHTRESIQLAKRNADSSDINNKRLITLNENSLALVKKNLANTERFDKVDMRAYLAIDSLYITQFIVTKSLKLFVYIKNVGKTPASSVNVGIDMKLGGTGLYPVEFNSVKITNKNIIAIGSGLGTNITYGGSFFLNRMDSIKIQSGEKPWYVFGLIIYQDIFGDSHRTKFCFQYSPSMRDFYHYGESNRIE